MEEKQSFKRNFYSDSDSGKVYLFALLVPVVLSFIFAFIASGFVDEGVKLSDQIWYVIIIMLLTPVSLLATFFIYNKTAKVSFGAVKLNPKTNWKNYLVVAFIGMVVLFGTQYFIGMVDDGLKAIGFELSNGYFPNNTFGYFALNVLLVALLPAIAEELIFRGVILQGLRRNGSDLIAIVLSALMFAGMHCSLQQFVYPIIIGLVFGWIVVRTGSLMLTIFAHFLNNFVVVLIGYLQTVTTFDMNLPSSWWAYLIAILLLVITGVILFLVDKFYFKRFASKEEQVKKEKSFKPSRILIISWAVGIFLLIFMTVMNFID